MLQAAEEVVGNKAGTTRNRKIKITFKKNKSEKTRAIKVNIEKGKDAVMQLTYATHTPTLFMALDLDDDKEPGPIILGKIFFIAWNR